LRSLSRPSASPYLGLALVAVVGGH
jgi:hypothetical protein